MAATLADEFLADLDSESEEEDVLVVNQDIERIESKNESKREENGDVEITEADPLRAASSLLYDDRIEELMVKMNSYDETLGGKEQEEGSCQNILVEIGDDVTKIHKLVQDHFSKRFYDLESLVVSPMDYIRVVQRMVTAPKLSQVDLDDLLPGPTIMVIKMSASTSATDVTLEDESIRIIKEACEGAVRLEKCQEKILAFVESRMLFVAPNLSALVGTSIAAKLIGIAGGLLALSRLPSSTLQILGSDKRTLEGFSTVATARKHVGYIYDAELVQNTPPSLRSKTVRVLAPKCTLAVRVDSSSKDANNDAGETMKSEILKKIEKWQERAPAKQIKALPAPDEKSKVNSTRGGKRVRKMKEKYAMTEYRKYANRLAFGVAEETHGNTEQGFGMIGVANKVKLHVVRDKKLQKQLHHRQVQREKRQFKRGIRTNVGGASGLASSLVITPVQGMELIDPALQAKKVEEANQKYFGASKSFSKVGK